MSLIINGKTTFGSRIVTTGLVAHLDAATYSGSGTWNDLGTTSLNGTLSDVTYSKLYSGVMVFNGSSSKISLPNVNITNNGKLTVEIWVYSNNTTQIQDIIDTADIYGIWFCINHPFGGVGYISTSLSSSILPCVNSVFTFNRWNQVVCVADGTYFKQYVNGVYTDQVAGTCINNINFDTARIGNVDGDRSTEYLSGYVSNVKIYNRDLSQSEILQNYNALKNRFGI